MGLWVKAVFEDSRLAIFPSVSHSSVSLQKDHWHIFSGSAPLHTTFGLQSSNGSQKLIPGTFNQTMTWQSLAALQRSLSCRVTYRLPYI